ncbi:MAG: hypothetical protein NC429_10555 [Lachnospiraceae bacterium]|nr:hypothetical protein [Lachnospiraceae bacterium]
MKRKLALSIIAIIISVGLMACGSNNSDSPAQIETVAQEEPELENAEEEKAEPAEVSEESSPEPAEEEPEVIEEEADVPYWYMDSEGIKNEELGIVIKKDVAVTYNFTLETEIQIQSLNDNRISVGNFSCGYYEGDLDTYISEIFSKDAYWRGAYDEIKKGKIGDIDYAYTEGGSVRMKILLVSNGIVFSAVLPADFGSAEEQLKRILGSENEINSLAFITDDGFHIPALGIVIAYDSRSKEFEDWIFVSGINEGITLRIEKVEDAWEKVDSDLQGAVSDGYAIEEMPEINIGKYQYSRRGYAPRDNWYWWYFTSDNMKYYIELYGDTQYSSNYMDYISVIENLE